MHTCCLPLALPPLLPPFPCADMLCVCRHVPVYCIRVSPSKPFNTTPNTDTLLPILTVEEMLMYTAELKQPRQVPLADKQAAVEDLLDKLNLKGCR